jgi:hypothetical protein
MQLQVMHSATQAGIQVDSLSIEYSVKCKVSCFFVQKLSGLQRLHILADVHMPLNASSTVCAAEQPVVFQRPLQHLRHQGEVLVPLNLSCLKVMFDVIHAGQAPVDPRPGPSLC